jgi:2-polyprenyl-3-methyl-5-hydroxy-6-metoxy-1,4-benzoquinol methylase
MIENFTIEKRFDNIILSHILEHLNDPIMVLKRIKKLLHPQGRLFIVVPNALSLHRQVGVAMGLLNKVTTLNDADRSVDHKRVYTPTLLKRHCKSAGLLIEKFGGIFLKLLSNDQIQTQWSPELIQGCFELGKRYPNLCSEIFVVCE